MKLLRRDREQLRQRRRSGTCSIFDIEANVLFTSIITTQ